MARKRVSLKDKQVFRRSKELNELLSDQDPQADETAAEGAGTSNDANLSFSLNTTDEETAATTENLAGLSEEAATASEPASETVSVMEDLPSGEADFDISGSLSEEAAVATTDTQPQSDENLNFPPALESPPAREDDLGFPPALESPPTGSDELGFPPAMEAPPATEDEFGFPPAMEAPPVDAVPEDAGFAGLEDPGTFPPALDPATQPSSEPPAFGNIPAADTGPENLEPAVGDVPDTTAPAAGFGPANTFDRPAFSPDPTAFSEASAPAINDTQSRPVPPPTSSPPPVDDISTNVPPPPQSDTGPVAISTPTALAIDDESEPEFFDFMGVVDEPKTIKYQIPDDIEELTLEERKRRKLLLTDEYVKDQFEKIYKEVDTQYQKLLDDNISSNQEITDWAQNLLAETRFILMNYQVEHLPKAEWNIQQVKARIDRAEESEYWRKRWVWPIVAWGLLWFFLFIFLLFEPSRVSIYLQSTSSSSDLLNVEIFLQTIFFGGIGAVASVFYSILKYVSDRSYDKEYNVTYFIKPFMGMIVGTLIYLIIFVVGRALNIVPAGTMAGASVEDMSKIQVFAVVTFFVALAGGFQEHIALRLLGRVMKIIFRDDREPSSTSVQAVPPSGPFD